MRIVLADAFNFVKESYEVLSAMVEVVWCDSRPGLLERILLLVPQEEQAVAKWNVWANRVREQLVVKLPNYP